MRRQRVSQACLAIDPAYAPQLTFAVVKKKHGTRLVAADPRDSDGKGNLRPGTVVDRAVVSTAGFDFFLNSHQGTHSSGGVICSIAVVGIVFVFLSRSLASKLFARSSSAAWHTCLLGYIT